MRRKGPQRHSNEIIQRAIQMWEGGMSLSAISRELQISKTTIKYWVDNMGKFKPEANGQSLETSAPRVQREATLYGWGLLIRAFKQSSRKLDQATFRDLTELIKALLDRLQQMGAAAGEPRVPSRVLEVRQKYTLEVQEFLQNQEPPSAAIEPATASEGSLATAQVERRPADEAGMAAESAAPGQTEGNGAT